MVVKVLRIQKRVGMPGFSRLDPKRNKRINPPTIEGVVIVLPDGTQEAVSIHEEFTGHKNTDGYKRTGWSNWGKGKRWSDIDATKPDVIEITLNPDYEKKSPADEITTRYYVEAKDLNAWADRAK